MRIALLLLLLLLLKARVITSAHLVERQPQELWNPVNTFGATLTVLGGVGTYLGNAIGNLFQNPQDSDTSKTIPPPDSLRAPPASPLSLATSSPAEPLYKININNDQSPDIVPPLQGIQPLVNKECDVSLHICFRKLAFQVMTLTLNQTNMGIHR